MHAFRASVGTGARTGLHASRVNIRTGMQTFRVDVWTGARTGMHGIPCRRMDGRTYGHLASRVDAEAGVRTGFKRTGRDLYRL